MSAAVLVPGHVVAYRFLWERDRLQGHREGAKTRPCVIFLVDEDTEPGSRIVSLVPITHGAPDLTQRPVDRIALPVSVKARLRLDDEASWIVLTEANRFTWPGFGYDLRRTPDGREGYGSLSPRALVVLLEALRATSRREALTRIDRDD